MRCTLIWSPTFLHRSNSLSRHLGNKFPFVGVRASNTKGHLILHVSRFPLLIYSFTHFNWGCRTDTGGILFPFVCNCFSPDSPLRLRSNPHALFFRPFANFPVITKSSAISIELDSRSSAVGQLLPLHLRFLIMAALHLLNMNTALGRVVTILASHAIKAERIRNMRPEDKDKIHCPLCLRETATIVMCTPCQHWFCNECSRMPYCYKCGEQIVAKYHLRRAV